ncbi:protein FAR1-RELATED SEQUENCE 5-like isoform X4 [Carya illinoinensis]|uniref:protein FAR1-RELATED SEQUENCE 5-like isoform X4 n=1 Tax=Carya illinoinensis TaxID=32201 RepID=UPI001C718BE2|nr:protein FAR1-RELATED SEQUENCE 5-like isoform X4 [Carya illinoinensis]XP_042966948.1 protein FAR1-RELATED SEQUENCE 5-like isoform X4 [Carya illinoinensis]
MGKEEDGRPPRPSTSTSTTHVGYTQGYYGTVNPYNPPYMMPSNTFPIPYPYAWGSQYVAVPPFGPNMASSMVSKPKELGRDEDTNQYVPMRPFGPMMPSPPSSNPEEFSRGEHTTQQYVAMPPPFAMPPFVPSLASPPSSNPEEFSRGEPQTMQGVAMPPPFAKPTFAPPCPSPLLSIPEELRGAEDSTQYSSLPPFGPTMPSPTSSNPDESRRVENTTQHSTMPPCGPSRPYPHSTTEIHVGETEPEITESPDAEGMNDLSDDDEKVDPPTAGMKFPSDNEVLLYYKRYAKQEGFGVIIKRTKRDLDGNAKYVTIGCARGGRYYPSYSNLAKPRATTKTDCKAKVNARVVNGEWVLTSVELLHNHSTVSPKKSRFFRSHRVLDEYSQRMLDLNDRAGIRMNKNFQALVTEAGGFENLEFQEKDCRNYIDKARYLRMGKGGGEALNDYFTRMRKMNDGFVSVMDVDDEFRVRNVFWADARSRAAYAVFGDVITFDTTYLTNRYGMPFAPFVGVNHHGQSILLGAGLISSEDTSTFVWLFEAWLECMNGRAPQAIITDQDRAMKNAIGIVFPQTRHRYYLWHIMLKLPEKLGSHGDYDAGLKANIQNAVYDTQTCDEFEEKWQQLMNKYDLMGNAWLEGLYTERSFWVPVYLKGVFWAGMSTTQRSESMNAFFDGYVHSGTTLKEFVDQYDNALRKKVETETAADFQSCNQTIPCVSSFKIERQFQSLYTNAKFKEVQSEVWGMLLCNPSLVSTQGSISTFEVLEEISTPDGQTKIVKYNVYLNEEEFEIKCTCGLFEMRGIICRHAFKVCQLKYIHHVPDKYVLDRWRKDIKRSYRLVKSSYDDCRANTDSRRHDVVVKRCLRFARRVPWNDEHVSSFFQLLEEFEQKVVGLQAESGSTRLKSTVDADRGKKILSPLVIRGKGRPPTRRKVPMVEKAGRKRKKKQTYKRIFVEEDQMGHPMPAEEVAGGIDEVVLPTQCSNLTQVTPPATEQV